MIEIWMTGDDGLQTLDDFRLVLDLMDGDDLHGVMRDIMTNHQGQETRDIKTSQGRETRDIKTSQGQETRDIKISHQGQETREIILDLVARTILVHVPVLTNQRTLK